MEEIGKSRTGKKSDRVSIGDVRRMGTSEDIRPAYYFQVWETVTFSTKALKGRIGKTDHVLLPLLDQYSACKVLDI